MLIVLGIVWSIGIVRAQTDSLIRQLTQAKEDTLKVQLLWDIGASVVFQSPLNSMPYFEQSVRLAQQLDDVKGLEKGYTGILVAYNFNGQYEKALPYSDSAIIYSHRVNDPNRLALVYLNKSDVLFNLYDYKNSLKFSQIALSYALKTGNKDRLGRIYGIISNTYRRQDQYELAMEYQNKEIGMYRDIRDFNMVSNGYQSKAMLLLKMKKYQEALLSIQKAIAIADSVQEVHLLSSFYSTEADILMEVNDYKNAQTSVLKALDYANLTQHERQKWFATGQMVKIDTHLGLHQQAIINGKAAYEGFKQLNDLGRQQGMAALLAETYEKTGNKLAAFDYLKISTELADSLNRQAYNTETARLQTEMNVAEKEYNIQLLQKDKELQLQKLRRQQLMLVGAFIILVLLASGAYLLFNQNRMKQHLKELQLRNEIAADLHDEVGSSLSSINMLSQIAVSNVGSQQEILKKVSNYARETIEKMSDIVWMIKPADEITANLIERMEKFLYGIGHGKGISTHFELSGLEDKKLSMEQRKALYLVFKEAVNNAVKHAEATHRFICFH